MLVSVVIGPLQGPVGGVEAHDWRRMQFNPTIGKFFLKQYIFGKY